MILKFVLAFMYSYIPVSTSHEYLKKEDFIVVVSDFSCKACHNNIKDLYESIRNDRRVRLQVILVTSEKLQLNINKNCKELSEIYGINSSDVGVYMPDEFLKKYHVDAEHLSRSPFVILRNKECIDIINQKDLSLESEKSSVLERLRVFYK